MRLKKVVVGDIFKCTDTTKNNFNANTTETYNYWPTVERTTIHFNLCKFNGKEELHKKQASLLKVRDGIYIDRDSIESILDYMNILIHRNHPSKTKFTLISSFPIGYGSLFVKEEQLVKSEDSGIFAQKSKKMLIAFISKI